MWEPDFSLLGEPVKAPPMLPPLPPLPMAPPPPRPPPALWAPPPKRCMTESVTESVTDVPSGASVTARMPYAQRAIVLPKPRDPGRPFRHAGLMREIGGVQGFLKVVRGTHRFPEPAECEFL